MATQDISSQDIESTFLEETLDKDNYEVCLKKEDIAKIARIEYGWRNDKTSKVLFEVVGSIDELHMQLDCKFKKGILKTTRSKKLLIFIINLGDNNWVTLVVNYQQKKIFAYYIDSLRKQLTENIRTALKKKQINVIENVDIELEYDNNYNCGIYALESARIVSEAWTNSSPVQIELKLNTSKEYFIEKRIEFAETLHREEIMQHKIEFCLKTLRHFNSEEMVDFSYKNANILILFLEVIALQDLSLNGRKSKSHESAKIYKTGLIERGVISKEDLELVKRIRTNMIIHRKDKNILEPSDLKLFINEEILDKNSLFIELERYLTQAYTIFKGENVDSNDVKKLTQLFQIGTIENDKNDGNDENDNKLKEKVLMFLRNATIESYNSSTNNSSIEPDEADKIIFEFIVNDVPLIEMIYKKSFKYFKDIKFLRNELLHSFYNFDDTVNHRYEYFKSSIYYYKCKISRIYYAGKVGELLRTPLHNRDLNEIDKELQKSISEFQNQFGKTYIGIIENDENSCNLLVSKKYEKIIDESDLKSFVNEATKLMYVIDNEDELNRRNVNGKELTETDRKDIYENFQILKSKVNTDEYEKEKKSFLTKCEHSYGISANNFQSMVKSFESDNDYNKGEENIVEFITKQINILRRISMKYPNVSTKTIIDIFKNRKNNRGKVHSIENKIHSICEGSVRSIDIPVMNENGVKVVNINTDTFVQNLYAMFNITHIKYILKFNTVGEAFKDQLFLDCLVIETKSLYEKNKQDFVNKLLDLEYTAPYIARLIMKNILTVTDEKMSKLLKILLKDDSYIVHLKELLDNNTIESSLQLYKKIVEIIIINDNIAIKNMDSIFMERTHTEGILDALEQNENDNGDDRKIKLSKQILERSCTIAEQLYFEEKYDKALNLLNLYEITDRQNYYIEKAGLKESDIICLKRQFTIAMIKTKQAGIKSDFEEACEQYTTAKKILFGILGVLKNNKLFDTNDYKQFHLNLLTLNDLAYTHYLLNEYEEAYKYLQKLYCYLSRRTFKTSNNDFDSKDYKIIISFDNEDYEKLVNSEAYLYILNLTPKYLSIFHIRSEIARVFEFLADKERSPLRTMHDINDYYKTKFDEVLKYYSRAIDIYTNDSKIKATSPLLTVNTLKNKRNIARINNKLGELMTVEEENQNNLEKGLLYYEKAREKYLEVCDDLRKQEWDTHPGVLNTLLIIEKICFNIARTHNNLSKFKLLNKKERMEHCEEALKIYKTLHESQQNRMGEEDRYTLCNLKNIAYTYLQLGNLKSPNDSNEAEKHYQKSLKLYNSLYKIQEKNLGKEHEFTLGIKYSIAFTHLQFGNLKSPNDSNEAEKHYQKSLKLYYSLYKIQEKNLGKEHEFTLGIKYSIAFTHLQFGNLKSPNDSNEAEKHYQKSLKLYYSLYKIQEKNLGEEHEFTLGTKCSIAFTHLQFGNVKSSNDSKKAEKHYQKSLEFYNSLYEIQERILGNEDKFTLSAQYYIALTRFQFGELKSSNDSKEAKKHYQKSLETFKRVHEIQKRTLGNQHKFTLKIQDSIRLTHLKVAKLKPSIDSKEAEEHHLKSFEFFNSLYEI